MGATDIFLIYLGIAIFWLWGLIDIVRSDFKDSINKIIWLLLAFFAGPLGTMLYLLIGRKQRVKKEG